MIPVTEAVAGVWGGTKLAGGGGNGPAENSLASWAALAPVVDDDDAGDAKGMPVTAGAKSPCLAKAGVVGASSRA